MHLTGLTCVALLLVGQAEPVFDVPAILAPPLAGRTLKTTEKDGVVVEEVMFHSETDGPKKVDIFGLFAYPKGGRGLPAFVWNQGGLAQASAHFPALGAKRGYAVLCIDFPLPGYRSGGGYPIVSGVDLPADPRQAPIYHGAVALLRAVSYLESRPEVDKTRLGMAGSSWGGFYTSLMTGLDRRLKVGSSMFGSGALDRGNAWWFGQGRSSKGAAFHRRWRDTLDPARYLATTKSPVGWFTGTNDSFYWLPAVAESARAAGGPTHLALLPNWNHALTAPLDEQVFTFLDIHLKGAKPFLAVGDVRVEDGHARWTVRGPRKLASTVLLVSPGEEGNWVGRPWLTVPATAHGGRHEAALPKSGVPLVVAGSVTDADGFISSTPPITVKPTAPGQGPPAYDGCAMWGDFEAAGVDFLARHSYPVPPLGPDAKAGKQAAALKPGTTTLHPVQFVAGVPHTLRAWVKADRAAELGVALVGTFDGKEARAATKHATTTTWSAVELPFTPPAAVVGSLRLELTVPPGTTVRLDDVSFRPAKE